MYVHKYVYVYVHAYACVHAHVFIPGFVTESKYFLLPPPTQAVRSNCSIVDIYVSYTNPHPNPAIYAEKYTASDGRPAFLQMEGQSNGLPVFATLMGTRLGDPACLNPGYEMKFETLNREWVTKIPLKKYSQMRLKIC